MLFFNRLRSALSQHMYLSTVAHLCIRGHPRLSSRSHSLGVKCPQLVAEVAHQCRARQAACSMPSSSRSEASCSPEAVARPWDLAEGQLGVVPRWRARQLYARLGDDGVEQRFMAKARRMQIQMYSFVGDGHCSTLKCKKLFIKA
jgi:hypothetical protein